MMDGDMQINEMTKGDKLPAGDKIATLTIHEAPAMSEAQRHDIARWLQEQADRLVLDGERYAPQFTGHYLR